MPDWKPEIRRRLAALHLSPTREAAIVEELAQDLDDCYAESLSGGATADEAYRAALAELSESELLVCELWCVERSPKRKHVGRSSQGAKRATPNESIRRNVR